VTETKALFQLSFLQNTFTMADTAAFFAKKKKGGKKKSFKAFNANKIDAAAISSNVHV